MKRITLALTAVFFLATAGLSQTQTMPPAAPPSGEMQHSGMQGMNCQAMMREMQSGMKEMDERLAQLVEEMNMARRSARIDKVAAVINELVAQRRQMRERMTSMMPKMMSHMMQHMQEGMMSGMSQGMKSCPMMQMAASAQAQHH